MIKYQKVIKVGNSLAVTLDPRFVAQADLNVGDQLAASYKHKDGVISLAKTSKSLEGKLLSEKEAIVSAKVTPEFQQWVEHSLLEDSEAMEKLKDL